MELRTETIQREELIPLKLKALYERFGYGKFRMTNFENYDLYWKNRNFLDNESIITFSDSHGKLKALKPDVTISIVNSVTKTDEIKKVYYEENIYRKRGDEFREIDQIGIEYIGGDSLYAELEVLQLAVLTLKTISHSYVLSVGHIGFLTAFFEQFDLSKGQMKECLRVLKNKSPHMAEELFSRLGIDEEGTKAFLSLMSVSGDIREQGKKLSVLATTDAMKEAAEELRCLAENLCAYGISDGVELDFSVINDFDYYNGMLFQGFVSGVPAMILSGGRYDNLMKRLGKRQTALGFALYYGDLERYLSKKKEYDADILLIFGDMEKGKVLKEVLRLTEQRKSVLARRVPDAGLRTKEVLYLTENGLEGGDDD